jgi:NitT/TauT family transport system substrate-binding protein
MFTLSTKRIAGVAALVTTLSVTGACGSGANDAGSGANGVKAVSVLPPGVRLTGGQAGTPAPKALPAKETLKVGIPSKLELVAPALLAQVKGEYAKENLNVEFVADTVPNLLTLVGQDRIDLLYGGAQALVFNAVRRSVPIRWVSGVAASSPDSGLFMSKKFGSSAKDFDPARLKGTNIGVNPGGLAAPSEYSLYQALTKAGLKSGDIKMTTFNDPASMVQALEGGRLDGATLGPPYTANLKSGFQVESSYPSDMQIAGYFATTRLLGKRRAAGVAFFRALERTVNTYLTGDYHKNSDVMNAIAKQLGTTVASLNLAPAVTFDFNVPAKSVDSLQAMYKSVPRTLQYTKPVTAAEVIDLSLVVDAAEGK